jgi:hypothetical protein
MPAERWCREGNEEINDRRVFRGHRCFRSRERLLSLQLKVTERKR